MAQVSDKLINKKRDVAQAMQQERRLLSTSIAGYCREGVITRFIRVIQWKWLVNYYWIPLASAEWQGGANKKEAREVGASAPFVNFSNLIISKQLFYVNNLRVAIDKFNSIYLWDGA